VKSILISIQPQFVYEIASGRKTIEVRTKAPSVWIDWFKFRREMPKPMKCYIYCTHGLALYTRPLQLSTENYKTLKAFDTYEQPYINGKVIGEFTLNKVDKLGLADTYRKYGAWLLNDEKHLDDDEIEMYLKNSCLTLEQFNDYIGYGDFEFFQYAIGYLYHIDDLKIYNKPKELSEFLVECEKWKKPHIGGWFSQITVHCPYCKRKVEVYNTSGTWCCCRGTMSVKNTFKPKTKPLTKAPQSWCYVEEV